jgi:hypothetical protein
MIMKRLLVTALLIGFAAVASADNAGGTGEHTTVQVIMDWILSWF